MAWILVVDDDEALLRGVVEFLRRLGHHVDEAVDGVAAIKAVESDPVDVVLTDINMPEMDGIEVITTLRRVRPAVRVIAMSGGGMLPSDLLLGNAELLGAVSTLSKPFELDELKEVVEAALVGEPANDAPGPTGH